MSQDRDNQERRDAIDKTAQQWRDTVHKSGNTAYTFDEARRRVAAAVARGDRKRDDRNR